MEPKRPATRYAPGWVIVVLACMLSGIFLPTIEGQVIRAVCLDSDAPTDLATKAAEAGLDTLIIYFDRFGGSADEAALTRMREWAQAAQQSKLACYVAIRAFGPLSCLGHTEMKWRRCKNIFGASLPVVCPVDRGYWRDVVAEHVEAVRKLSREAPIRGLLLSLYRNWATERHSFDTCFCDQCVGTFFDPQDCGQDDETAFAEGRSGDERLALIRRELVLAPYHERQADAVTRIIRQEILPRSVAPGDWVFGLFDCADTWLDRAAMNGLAQNDKTVLVGLDVGERASMVELAGTCKARWAYAKLRTTPVVFLDTTYFLPEDVAHEAALLKDRDISFCLARTGGWWRRAESGASAAPALGPAEAYFRAIKDGPPAGSKRKFFAGRKTHPLIPRVALIHGEQWSWTACKVVADKLKNLDIYPDLFPAWGTEALEKGLGYYDVLVLAPGYEKADRKFFANVTGGLNAYLHYGGVLSVLGADANEKISFLREMNPELALRVSSDLGTREGKPNLREPVVQSPLPVTEAIEGKAYLEGFEGKYTSLVSRDNGGSYLVKKDVGKGMLTVTPGTAIPFAFVANLWVAHRSGNESLVLRIMSGGQYLRTGENRLLIGVGDQRLGDRTLSVQMDVISPAGDRAASKSSECVAAFAGEEIPLEFEATTVGRHLLVVTVCDPESRFVLGRRIIPMDVQPAIRLSLEKNYYSGETEAMLRVLCDPVACSPADVKVFLEGSDPVPCELVKAGLDEALFRVPVGKASPGTLRVTAKAGDLSATRPLIKREPREGETKIVGEKALSFMDNQLLPIGSFDFNPTTGKDLAEAGLRMAVCKDGDVGPVRAMGVQVIAEPTEERLQQSGSYLAWSMGEEVCQTNFAPQDALARYKATKEKDPYRPVVGGVNGDLSGDSCGAYMPAYDAFWVSSYPLPFYRIGAVGEAVRYAVEATRAEKPVWFVCQDFDWRDSMGLIQDAKIERSPSRDELRNMVLQALANGANGVLFWRYPEFDKHPKRREALKNLLAEMEKLKPFLTSPDSRQQIILRPPSSPVAYRAFDHEGKIYLLACNPTRQRQEAEFELPFTIRSAGILDQNLETVGSILDVALDPLDAKVYVLSP
ncbi:MAG: hypothetical protein AB1696_21070 [Planctomycetota bacterium]